MASPVARMGLDELGVSEDGVRGEKLDGAHGLSIRADITTQ